MNVITEIREECQRNNASGKYRYEDWQIPEQLKRYIMQTPSLFHIPVKLADLSIGGMGLYIPNNTFGLKKHDEIGLHSFDLPLLLTGKIRYINECPGEWCRIGISLTEDSECLRYQDYFLSYIISQTA